MISERPTDPQVLQSIEACIADLFLLIKTMKKEKALSIKIGCVKDQIMALELVRDWGAHGGKVPWPVTEPGLTVFRKHNLEKLIHEPWEPKHRE